METYQRTIFAIVKGGFGVAAIAAILITVANGFGDRLHGNEIGAASFIVAIACAGILMTRLILRIV